MDASSNPLDPGRQRASHIGVVRRRRDDEARWDVKAALDQFAKVGGLATSDGGVGTGEAVERSNDLPADNPRSGSLDGARS